MPPKPINDEEVATLLLVNVFMLVLSNILPPPKPPLGAPKLIVGAAGVVLVVVALTKLKEEVPPRPNPVKPVAVPDEGAARAEVVAGAAKFRVGIAVVAVLVVVVPPREAVGAPKLKVPVFMAVGALAAGVKLKLGAALPPEKPAPVC